MSYQMLSKYDYLSFRVKVDMNMQNMQNRDAPLYIRNISTGCHLPSCGELKDLNVVFIVSRHKLLHTDKKKTYICCIGTFQVVILT